VRHPARTSAKVTAPNALTPPPRSIWSTQPLQNRRVRVYEVSEVSGNARVGALFAIVKALYYKHFADQCEFFHEALIVASWAKW
jgi:hypothetical protein